MIQAQCTQEGRLKINGGEFRTRVGGRGGKCKFAGAGGGSWLAASTEVARLLMVRLLRLGSEDKMYSKRVQWLGGLTVAGDKT